MTIRGKLRFHAITTAVRLRKNFTGVWGYLDMNCRMIGRALSVAVGLLGVCFAVSAQQTHGRPALQNASVLSLYQPKIFSAKDKSLLFHKGPVYAWSDGGRLASNNALAEIGMASLDLFPVGYLPPNTSGAATTIRASATAGSSHAAFESEGKDFPGMMTPAHDQVYYSGEVGILYGQWTGKGGGDLMQSYIMGTVGNDKLQISVGAEYDESSGRSARYHSYFFPR